MKVISTAIAVAVAGMWSTPPASAAIFDFEEFTATASQGGGFPGALQSLVTTKDGLTATITRPASRFDVASVAFARLQAPPSFGFYALSPYLSQPSAAPFIVSFSTPISFFSVDYGGFLAPYSIAILEGFSGPDGTGSLLATTSDTGGVNDFPSFSTAMLSGSGINSVVMSIGNRFDPNGVYYDNLRATPQATATVPEPGSLILLGSCLLAAARFPGRSGRPVDRPTQIGRGLGEDDQWLAAR